MRSFVLLLLLALAAPFASASPAARCKPVTGHFLANLVPPGQGHCPPAEDAFCTAGRVWGGLQGDYEFVMTQGVPSEPFDGLPTVVFFTGESTVFVKRGDQLFGVDTGSIDLPPGQGGFASLITFDGGTGAMAGAGGQIRLRGEFDAQAGTTSGDYAGSLCTP